MHPNNLVGSLAQDRHAERYGGSHSTHEGGRLSSENRETARRRVGWLLVGLGLRLISSQPFRGEASAAHRARLIGQ